MKKIILVINFLIIISSFLTAQLPVVDEQKEVHYDSEIDKLKFNNYDCDFIDPMYASIEKNLVEYDYLVDGTPLIHWLCLCDNLKLVQLVCDKKNADLNILSRHGSTPLMYALFNGNMEIIKCLLNKKVLLGGENNFNEDEIQFLIEGKSDNIELLNLIIKDEYLLRIENEHFNDLLGKSIANGKNNLYTHLWALYLKRKTKLSTDLDGFLSRAISSGNLFVIDKLLSRYALSEINLTEPLINQVCQKMHYYNLFTRVYNEDKIRKDDSLDVKLLDLVVRKANVKLDEVLIENTDILFNVSDNYPVIKFLASKKNSINRSNSEGKTFLEFYIDKVINSDLINFNGKLYPINALNRDYSTDFGMVKFLIEHGAIANKDYQNGWTYLILESLKSKKGLIVEKLINAEPSIFIKDDKGKSAIDYAMANGDDVCKDALKQLLEKADQEGHSKN
jgi:ankyrin repeat protein